MKRWAKIQRWIKRHFLLIYDRNPFLGCVVGIVCIIFVFVCIGSVTAAVKEFIGIPAHVQIFILAPLFLFILQPFFMVMWLIGEFMWRSLGIYSILGIKGRPLRESFNSKNG